MKRFQVYRAGACIGSTVQAQTPELAIREALLNFTVFRPETEDLENYEAVEVRAKERRQ